MLPLAELLLKMLRLIKDNIIYFSIVSLCLVFLIKDCCNKQSIKPEPKLSASVRVSKGELYQQLTKYSPDDSLVKEIQRRDKYIAELTTQIKFGSISSLSSRKMNVRAVRDTIKDTVQIVKYLTYADSSLNLTVQVTTDSAGRTRAVLDSFMYRTSYEVTLGKKTKPLSQFFSPDAYIVKVRSTGRDSVVNLQNITVHASPQWYEKKSTYFVAGGFLGIFLSSLLLK